MPSAPKRLCNQPGCTVVLDRPGRCERHLIVRRAEPGRRIQKGHIYDGEWRRLSEAFRKEHPFCAYCDRPSKDVHHIIPAETSPELRLEWTNLVALCRSCHVAESMQEGSHMVWGRKSKGEQSR